MSKNIKEGDKRLGNQFWKLRSKHGRHKLFETPELMWEAACEYFEWVDANPLISVEYDKLKVNGKGDELIMIDVPKKRPYTIMALCIYLDCNTKYFNDFKDAIKDSSKKIDIGFSEVITRIEEIIQNQKFEGAAAGFFNPNIIARDLGLIDRKDIKSDDKPLNEAKVVLPDGMELDDYLSKNGLK